MGDVDQAKLEKALIDAVFRLCGTFLPHADSIEVRGLLGITLDKSNIVWVDLKEEQEGTVVKTSQPVPRGRGRRTRSKGKVVDSENALASTVDASDEYISLELAVHGEVDSDDIPPEDPDFEHETPQRKRRKRGNPAWTPKPKGGRRVETATKTDTQALVVKTEPDSFIKSMEDDDESDAGEALYDEEPPVPSESFDMSLGVGSMEPDGSISVMLDPSEDLEADDDDDVKKLETNDDDDDEDDEEPSTSTAGHVELDASTGEIMVIPGESKPVRIVSGAVNKFAMVSTSERADFHSIAESEGDASDDPGDDPGEDGDDADYEETHDVAAVTENKIKKENTTPSGNKRRIRQCKLCSFTTHSSSVLTAHRRRQHGMMITCDQCENSPQFTCKTQLRCHVQVVHENNLFTCDQCPRKFNSRSGLWGHIKSAHNDTYKYICPICGHKTLAKQHHEAHMNTHFGVKPFSCENCKKDFALKSNWKAHMKICGQRERNRRHACPQCPQTFMRPQAMRDHVEHVHENKRVYCSCGKEFHWEQSLKRHQKKCLV